MEHVDLPQEQWRLLPSASRGSLPPLDPGVVLPGNSSPSPSVEPSNQSSPVSVCFERSASGSCPVESPGGQERESGASPLQSPEDFRIERGSGECDSVQGPDRSGGRHSPLASALLQRLTSRVGPVESPGASSALPKAPSPTGDPSRSSSEATGASKIPVASKPGKPFPDEPGTLPATEVNEDGEKATGALETPSACGPVSTPVRSPNAALHTLALIGLETQATGGVNTNHSTLVTDLPCSDLGPDGLSPDFIPNPRADNLELTRVPTQFELFTNPFEHNDATQEAAWRAGLGLTRPEKPARQRKVRQASAPKSKKVVTEAALIKNPALDGAALVGREVRVLDVKTRLWMWATVESFDATMGFRNTQVSCNLHRVLLVTDCYFSGGYG